MQYWESGFGPGENTLQLAPDLIMPYNNSKLMAIAHIDAWSSNTDPEVAKERS
jgi:hypothetical protein